MSGPPPPGDVAVDEGASFLNALRRRIWIPILCAALAGLGAAFLAARRPHEYRAVALLEVNDPNIEQSITAGLTQPPPTAASAAIQNDLPSNLTVTDIASQIPSYRTAQRAVEFLQLDPFLSPNQVLAATSVTVDPKTGLITITATAPRARDAARIANALARGYLNLREHSDIERIRQVRLRLERLARAEARGAVTSSTPGDLKSVTDGIAQLRLAAKVQPLSVDLVRPATPPSREVGVSPPVLGLLAASLGFVVGIGLIGVSEQSDRRASSLRGLERLLGAPVLCQVRKGRALRPAISPSDLEPRHAEPFRLLLARLRHDPSLEASHVVAVASTEGADDALGTAWYLSAAAGATGTPTLLVQAEDPGLAGREAKRPDPRNGNGQPGFHVPTGGLDVSHIEVGPGRHMDIVVASRPSGAVLHEDTEVAGDLLSVARETYDFIVVAMPPLPVPEAAVPLLNGTGVIAVCRSGSVDRDMAQPLREALATFDARLIGLVAVGFGGGGYP